MNQLAVFIFVLQILRCQSASDTDYCNKKLCPQDVHHIACNNDVTWHKDCSKDAAVVKLDKKLQDFILKIHNEKRNRIADCAVWENCRFGIAARMGKMRWNPELAFLAELNLRQCALKESICFATNEFPRPGQNLAYNKYPNEQNVSAIIQSQFNMWFDEYRHANMYHIYNRKQINTDKVRNFLQIVRDSANQVGCSVVRHTADQWHFQRFACKYSSGYQKCSPIYKTSSIVGNGCEKGIDETYRNLCNQHEKYDYSQCEAVLRSKPMTVKRNSESDSGSEMEEQPSSDEEVTKSVVGKKGSKPKPNGSGSQDTIEEKPKHTKEKTKTIQKQKSKSKPKFQPLTRSGSKTKTHRENVEEYLHKILNN